MGGLIGDHPELAKPESKDYTNDGGHFTDKKADVNMAVLPPIDQVGGPQVKKTLKPEPFTI